MGWRESARRAGHFWRRPRFDRDLAEEMRFHLEMRATELEQDGLAREAALAQARREFGREARVAEDARAAWQFQWVEDLLGDLRYAARAFARSPGFAATAITCLALGIGANTTIFSTTMEVLFAEPSCRDPRTLLELQLGGNDVCSMRDFRYLRQARVFDDLAGMTFDNMVNWRDGETTRALAGTLVTDNFFEVAGVPVASGRPIQRGDTRVVVVSDRFWRRRLGGDPSVVGRRLVLNGDPFVIVGVLPPAHRSLLGFGLMPDLYLPFSDRETFVTPYLRLAGGMTREQARGRLQAAAAELDRVYPEPEGSRAKSALVLGVTPLARMHRIEEFRTVALFFLVVMAMVALVLLIACANVSSLLLARASARAREMAVRLSLGAGRGRIVRQLLAETLLIAVAGTAAGLLVTISLMPVLNSVPLPISFVQYSIQPDWRLLLYSGALALAVTFAAGLAPALTGTRRGVAHMLGHVTPDVSVGRWPLRNLLVAGQLAVSMVLLAAAFLFVRNLARASSLDPGFDAEHAVWALVRLVPETGRDPAAVARLVRTATERVRALPGVEAVGVSRVVPLAGFAGRFPFYGPLRPDTAEAPIRLSCHRNVVGPGYFAALGIPIVRGRAFLPSDTEGTTPLVIVNENLARRLFGPVDPVGHVLSIGKKTATVAGVARNSRYFTLGEENALAFYEPYFQAPAAGYFHLLARTGSSPDDLAREIARTMAVLDPSASAEVQPMRRAIRLALAPSRAGAVMLGIMGVLGLVLASIGLYGLLLYMVSRRVREIGLRVALGATPGRVLGLVFGASARLAGTGLAAGTLLAFFAVQPLSQFLVPGIRPSDPITFILVAGVLCLVTALATLLPTLRALRVQPAVALRHE